MSFFIGLLTGLIFGAIIGVITTALIISGKE